MAGLAFWSAEAANLGTFGATFRIAEADLIEEIYKKLRDPESGGTMKTMQQGINEKIAERIKTPQPTEGIRHTEKPRTFEYDPTIEVTRDLKDHKGRIFAKKGDRFNPLDRIRMTKPLLFIDGEDKDHLYWAGLRLRTYPTAKVILVRGSPLEVKKKLNREIYFDQHGHITSKLGITQVPAVVYQRPGEKVLTIRETLAVSEKFSPFKVGETP
jgi:conjugal transfer pilus assembly protein TraW